MWLLIPQGFYSAVLNELDDTGETLQVRTRSRKDVEYLQDWLAREHGVDAIIHEWERRDYQFRVIIEKELWGSFLVAHAEEIDYTNFKTRVGQLNPKRATIYGRLWGVLTAVAREDEPVRPVATSTWYDAGAAYPPLGVRDLLGDEEHGGFARSIHDMTDDEWRLEMEEPPGGSRSSGKKKRKKGRR